MSLAMFGIVVWGKGNGSTGRGENKTTLGLTGKKSQGGVNRKRNPANLSAPA
jgi:hypothetical protein